MNPKVTSWHRADLPLCLAWLVALVATLGSLYFSEVRGFVPCVLCWAQRVCMYPLAVVLGLAAYRRDDGVWPYVTALALPGWGVALYHVLLERLPALRASGVCASGIPCDVAWVTYLGFVTIPVLSLLAFSLILAVAWIARHASR